MILYDLQDYSRRRPFELLVTHIGFVPSILWRSVDTRIAVAGRSCGNSCYYKFRRALSDPFC